MTDPKPCERCGQVDCPMIGCARSHNSFEDAQLWTAAFQACATMGRLVAENKANILRNDIQTILLVIVDKLDSR